ncbi:hypothetical protein PR003_g15823 [Phytophthora rubi]|uniref:RxLR effector protein n=1 Tax=Phytophthora rubi TaxID=129364 RepID=A0A6A3L8F2_9STRA|nr:hypothetical protein PR002_g14763 [Phytophthora rubi]KAE9015269.1 hypothetical protein PR001_g14939 [Phytophthora rubi]KAE9328276.1 hypothetical protein PR003_g15823 [Phytophthora rubi]
MNLRFLLLTVIASATLSSVGAVSTTTTKCSRSRSLCRSPCPRSPPSSSSQVSSSKMRVNRTLQSMLRARRV